MTGNQAIDTAKRIMFYGYAGFCLLTGVGGFLTGPLFTYLVYGDWRFWRHAHSGLKLFFSTWGLLVPMLKRENAGFMFSVPLTSPSYSSPLPDLVQVRPDWEHGSSCGSCTRCCSKIECPILEPETGLCGGYDSFFWRYFNCGRYPSRQPEIDYYGCPKWAMAPESAGALGVAGRGGRGTAPSPERPIGGEQPQPG